MPALSQYGARKLLDHITGKAAFTMPTVHVALLTTNPSTDAGAGLVEAAYTNYARVTTSAASWNTATDATPSVSSNAAALAFPICGTTGATVTGFALYDAATGGNLLWWDTITVNGSTGTLAVSNGIAPSFASGALQLRNG